MTGSSLYSCFDFRLSSEIPLPELATAGAGDSRPVVPVRLAALPETLAGGRSVGAGLEVAGEEAMLTIAETARYLVRDGREILVEPAPGGSPRNLRLFLLGSALGILCHQRGLLALHANGVVAGDRAFAFAGPSGAGKSSLAAYFAAAGHEILGDDVCAIAFEDGRPFAWPGLPRLKLWGDTLEAFARERGALEPAVEGMDKYHVPLADPAQPRPISFRRLYILSRAQAGAETAIRRLRGREAMDAVLAQTYRGQYLAPLGLSADHFRRCAMLLAHAEVYEASRAWGYERHPGDADRPDRPVYLADRRRSFPCNPRRAWLWRGPAFFVAKGLADAGERSGRERWWTGLDSNQRRGNPGRFTVCCL